MNIGIESIYGYVNGQKTLVTESVDSSQLLSALINKYQTIYLTVVKDGQLAEMVINDVHCYADYLTLDMFITHLDATQLTWVAQHPAKLTFNLMSYLGYTFKPVTLYTGQAYVPYIRRLMAIEEHDLKIIPRHPYQDGYPLATTSICSIGGVLHKVVYDGYDAYIIYGGITLPREVIKDPGLITFDHEIVTKTVKLDPSPSYKNQARITVASDVYPLVVIYGKIIPLQKVTEGVWDLQLQDVYLEACKFIYTIEVGELPEVLDGLINDWLSNAGVGEALVHPLSFVCLMKKPFPVVNKTMHLTHMPRYTTLQEPTMVMFNDNGIQHYRKENKGDYWEIRLID